MGDLLYGIHPLCEALAAGRRKLFKIHISKNRRTKGVQTLLKLARTGGVPVQYERPGTLIAHPGSFVRSNEVKAGIPRRAPLIGEHNLEVYEGVLDLSRKEIITLKQCGAI